MSLQLKVKLPVIMLFRLLFLNKPALLIEGEKRRLYYHGERAFKLTFTNLSKLPITKAVFQIEGYSFTKDIVCKTLITIKQQVNFCEDHSFELFMNDFQERYELLTDVTYLRVVDVRLTYANATDELVNRTQLISIIQKTKH